MTSYAPPTYYFNGINFNSNYFQSSSNSTFTSLTTGSLTSTGTTNLATTTGSTIRIGNPSTTANQDVYLLASNLLHINDSANSSSATYINNGNSNTGNVVIQSGTSNGGDLKMLDSTNSTGNISIQTGTGTTGNFTLGRPITTAYNPSAITTVAQVGWQHVFAGSSLNSVTSTAGVIGTLITLTAGVWSVNITVAFGTTVAGYVGIWFSTSNSTYDFKKRTDNTTLVNSNSFYGLNTTYVITASTTLYVWGISSSTFTTSSIQGYITRIA